MRRTVFILILVGALWPLVTDAVTRENFLLRNTQDLVALCTPKDDDPLRDAAVGFCYGYGVGAFHFYQTQYSGPDSRPFVCQPNPPPSRAETVQQFLSWVRANPQYLNEAAVDSIFRFLKATWPCKQ